MLVLDTSDKPDGIKLCNDFGGFVLDLGNLLHFSFVDIKKSSNGARE
jgi:hypothetical protein